MPWRNKVNEKLCQSVRIRDFRSNPWTKKEKNWPFSAEKSQY